MGALAEQIGLAQVGIEWSIRPVEFRRRDEHDDSAAALMRALEIIQERRDVGQFHTASGLKHMAPRTSTGMKMW